MPLAEHRFITINWPDGACYTGNVIVKRTRRTSEQDTPSQSESSSINNSHASQDHQQQQQMSVSTVRSGFGEMQYANGARYTGYWHNNMRCGQGAFTWPDGTCHEGLWANDLAEGSGVMVMANGERMAGIWTNGLLMTMTGKSNYGVGDSTASNNPNVRGSQSTAPVSTAYNINTPITSTASNLRAPPSLIMSVGSNAATVAPAITPTQEQQSSAPLQHRQPIISPIPNNTAALRSIYNRETQQQQQQLQSKYHAQQHYNNNQHLRSNAAVVGSKSNVSPSNSSHKAIKETRSSTLATPLLHTTKNNDRNRSDTTEQLIQFVRSTQGTDFEHSKLSRKH